MAQLSIQQAFDLALQHHHSGRLLQAEQLYKQILAQHPQNVDALHHLGLLACQAGRSDIAVDLIRRSIALAPNFPDAHNNLGQALQTTGRVDEAIAAYREAIALKPAFPEAHSNLATALMTKGCLAEAISSAQQAVALRPNYVEAQNNLGNALQSNGQLDEAIAAYRCAIALDPTASQPRINLGDALRTKGQFDEAIAQLNQAISLQHNLPAAHNNLGNALHGKGRLEQAIAAYRQAIALHANFPQAHNNLGNVLKDNGNFDEAIACYRHAIALNPDYAEAHCNLANIFLAQGQLDDAIAAYRRAIELLPAYPQAHCGLANALKVSGEIALAIESYRRSVELSPSDPDYHSNLLFALHDDPASDAQSIAREHRHWNQKHAQPLKKLIRPLTNEPDPQRRLRIGYVSPDFRQHAVASFLQPLLAGHDRDQFEIFAYSQVPRPDSMTQRLRSHTDHWRSLVGLSDARAADQIRQDQIDILIDLAGHTAGNRLLVFAQKPAPVQVTYLGYPNTTGLTTIDCRLTDTCADPPGQTERYHSEQLYRIDPCAWCFAAPNSMPASRRTDGPIVFACFNNFAKVNEPMMRLWANILASVPDSRLLLKARALTSPTVRERVLQIFQSENIPCERIELLGWHQSEAEHLALYNQVSIGLDPFPYHGTTTTCQALWMGVPVITLAGQTHVSRVGISLLSNLKLSELIAQTPEAYVRIAVELAADSSRLRQLHSTLRDQMEQSPLMNAPRFARLIESAYRQMWRTWCSEHA